MAHLKGRLQRSRAGNLTGLSGGEGPGARPATPTAPPRRLPRLPALARAAGAFATSRLPRRAAAGFLVVLATLLALPLQAQAQSTLVSNLGQGNDSSADFNPPVAQRFTTGSNPGGYTLSRVEIKTQDSDSFSVSVCDVNASSFPGSTCTALTAPGTFASGTLVFTAPADATLSSGTTYTVVATPAGTTLRLDATTADAEDTGGATGWSLADEYDWRNSSNMWTTNVTGKSLRVAIKGPTVQVPAAVSDVVVAPVPRPPTRCKSPGPLPMTRGGIT